VGIRSSVKEEIEAANRVATQVLGRVTVAYQYTNENEFKDFLSNLGRVRSNEIIFRNNHDEILYKSPPPVYKAGREAPSWFTAIVKPTIGVKIIAMPNGSISITPDPSRAILDGWEDIQEFFLTAIACLFLANVLVFLVLGRWLKPFQKIKNAIELVEQGDYFIRLDQLDGGEASAIGRAFNKMIDAINEVIQTKQEIVKTESLLTFEREFSQSIQEHIERERKEIAQELHDDLGQSITAIKSIAISIKNQAETQFPDLKRSCELLVEVATQMYDSMYRLIPKLRPTIPKQLGLKGVIEELVDQVRAQQPHIQFFHEVELEKKSDAIELAIYRVIQEAVTNALKHSGCSKLSIHLHESVSEITLSIENNGAYVESIHEKEGHYGITGMKERAYFLNGKLSFTSLEEGGLIVQLSISKLKNG